MPTPFFTLEFIKSDTFPRLQDPTPQQIEVLTLFMAYRGKLHDFEQSALAYLQKLVAQEHKDTEPSVRRYFLKDLSKMLQNKTH